MMPHTSKDGSRQVQRMLDDLDEMQSYIDPERRVVTVAVVQQRKDLSRRKLGEVMNFLAG